MTEPRITQSEFRPNKNGSINFTLQPIPPSTLNLSKETRDHQNPPKEAVSNHSNESHPSPSCTLFLATKYALIGTISIGICLFAVAFFRAEETAEIMLASPPYRRYNTKDRKYHYLGTLLLQAVFLGEGLFNALLLYGVLQNSLCLAIVNFWYQLIGSSIVLIAFLFTGEEGLYTVLSLLQALLAILYLRGVKNERTTRRGNVV